jgi:hypothetical protein
VIISAYLGWRGLKVKDVGVFILWQDASSFLLNGNRSRAVGVLFISQVFPEK